METSTVDGTMENTEDEEDNDLFSTLPLDCHLCIFTLFDRDTLDALERVSKGIQNVVNHPRLTRVKTKGELVIYEEPSGHGFAFNHNKCPRCNRVHGESRRAFLFHIERTEKRWTSTRFMRMLREIRPFRKEKSSKYQEEKVQKGTRSITEPYPHYVPFDDELDLEKFGQFLCSSNLKHLKISFQFQDVPSDFAAFLRVFNESFFTAFVAASTDPNPSFMLTQVYQRDPVRRHVFLLLYPMTFKIPYHWTPSNDFLTTLFCFRVLILCTISYTPEAIIEVILKRLEMKETEAHWEITIENQLTQRHLEAIDTRKFIVEDRSSSEFLSPRHRITKKSTGFYCELSPTYGTFGVCRVTFKSV